MKCKDCSYAWEEEIKGVLVCHCNELIAPCDDMENPQVRAWKELTKAMTAYLEEFNEIRFYKEGGDLAFIAEKKKMFISNSPGEIVLLDEEDTGEYD
jgi:tRNA U34 2-thiouridine synthase MnmA/TrmU